MDSKDLRRRHGELSQKIKSFKMAVTKDFSNSLRARRRSRQSNTPCTVDVDPTIVLSGCTRRRRRPASSCVSRHEWTSASRLEIEEPEFLQILHEQIWRSICYVKRQTLCFIEGYFLPL